MGVPRPEKRNGSRTMPMLLFTISYSIPGMMCRGEQEYWYIPDPPVLPALLPRIPLSGRLDQAIFSAPHGMCRHVSSHGWGRRKTGRFCRRYGALTGFVVAGAKADNQQCFFRHISNPLPVEPVYSALCRDVLFPASR